jgi:hypothetical protein
LKGWGWGYTWKKRRRRRIGVIGELIAVEFFDSSCEVVYMDHLRKPFDQLIRLIVSTTL